MSERSQFSSPLHPTVDEALTRKVSDLYVEVSVLRGIMETLTIDLARAEDERVATAARRALSSVCGGKPRPRTRPKDSLMRSTQTGRSGRE